MGFASFNFGWDLWYRVVHFARLAKAVLREARVHVRIGTTGDVIKVGRMASRWFCEHLDA